MKYLITESKLEKHIQGLIETIIRGLIEQSEDWGLGEMHELEVLNSVNRIEIDRIVSVKKIKVYINMYLNYYYDDMDDLRSEIQYKLEEWIPNIELYINQIYDLKGNPYEFNDQLEENNYLSYKQSITRVLKEDNPIERNRHRGYISTRQPGIESFLSDPSNYNVADYLSAQLNDDPYTKNRLDISRRISIIFNGMKMTPDQFINNIKRDYSAGKYHKITFYEYNNRILGKTQIKIDTTPGVSLEPPDQQQDSETKDPINTYVTQKIIEPVPFPSNFVSNFGQKRSYEIHPGIDISVPSGTEIKSPLDGIIETANINLNHLCGGAIDIIHPGGYWTRFCHVKQINVVTGQKIKQADIVGLSGGGKKDTGKGNSKGPHLHWTLKLNGVKVDASKHIGKQI